MNRRNIRITVSLIVALIAGHTISSTAAAEEREASFVEATTAKELEIQRYGEHAINRLAVTMMSEFRQALRDGKPEDAISSCHLKDLPMEGDGIKGLSRITSVKLTSLKVRSPANAPDDEDELALREVEYLMNYVGNIPDLLLQRIDGPGAVREWRVYRPLGVAKQCLTCHGDLSKQSPALRAKISELYPEDQAIDYRNQQWRGLIRVTVKEDASK